VPSEGADSETLLARAERTDLDVRVPRPPVHQPAGIAARLSKNRGRACWHVEGEGQSPEALRPSAWDKGEAVLRCTRSTVRGTSSGGSGDMAAKMDVVALFVR
jgi:hypothetical protein